MAFKRWSKALSKSPPKPNFSEAEMKIIAWCLNKKIGVGISPDFRHELNGWKIDLNINGKIHTDPSRYTNDEVYNKVNEYYKYYYDKYNKQ